MLRAHLSLDRDGRGVRGGEAGAELVCCAGCLSTSLAGCPSVNAEQIYGPGVD
jgi:hypothetical protein